MQKGKRTKPKRVGGTPILVSGTGENIFRRGRVSRGGMVLTYKYTPEGLKTNVFTGTVIRD
jgi:negative regulator of replication initiation